MSKNLSLSEVNGIKLQSNDIVRFRLQSDLTNEATSGLLKFQVPAFPDLVTTMSPDYYKTGPTYVDYFDPIGEYRINGKYKTYPITGTTASVKLSIQLTTAPTTIRTKDLLRITASAASSLTPINGQTFPCSGTNGTQKTVDLTILSGVIPTSGTVSSTINALRDIKKRVTTYTYIARVQPEKYKNFLLVPDPTNKQSYIVADVLIFYYTKTSTNPLLNDNKYLFNSTLTEASLIDVSNAIPPSYSNVSNMIGKSGTNMKFTDDGTGSLIKIYAAIARYKKINGEWIGTWVKDTSLNPIVAEVLPRKVGSSKS